MSEAVETVRALFKGTPTNSWDAILRQLLFWSARRFCVDRLISRNSNIAEPLDLSGVVPVEPQQLWETHFDLMEEFAPGAFSPYLRDWLSPEHFQSLSKSYEIDLALRALVVALDQAVFSEEEDHQEAISSLLDDELPALFESWLGISFAPLLFFPTADESDEEIAPAKLHSILLLMRVYKPDIHKRKTARVLNSNMKTQLRKTRRQKQKHERLEVPVPLRPTGPDNDSRGNEGENHGSGSEERKGTETSDSAEERKDADKQHEVETVGN